MKRIAILTSGGDAPGMNAAIRAVARSAIDQGWKVFGIQNGFAGLIGNQFRPLDARSVGGIIQQGGTVLGTSRCPEFQIAEGRTKALSSLQQNEIDALVVIGGNGSQTGSYEISKMHFPVVGIASTIDNDLFGSEICIGVDTALNIALEAIDRLRVTASSHHRAILVEVMGRDSGYLALMAAIAGGAEVAVIPEKETNPDTVAAQLRASYKRGKSHALVVVAEGSRYNAEAMQQHFAMHKDQLGFELRVTTLGHVQRGGSPNVFDRLLATRLGAAATQHLVWGEYGVLLGQMKGEIKATPLAEVAANKKKLDLHLLELAEVLAK